MLQPPTLYPELYPERLWWKRLKSLGLSGKAFEYALLPAKDAKRVKRIAEGLDTYNQCNKSKENPVFYGKLGQSGVVVTNSGLGGPQTALTLETLIRGGAQRIIRVGSCGGLQDELKTGDIVIAAAALRMDGTSAEYIDPSYPASADTAILQSLILAANHAAERLGVTYHVGIIVSHDAFFAESLKQYRMLSKLKVLGIEMEVSTIFTLANLRRVAAGAILVVTENMLRGRAKGSFFTDAELMAKFDLGMEKAIDIALETVKLHSSLMRKDLWRR